MKLYIKLAIWVIGIISFSGINVYASEITSIGASGFYVAEDVLYITDSYTNQIYQYDASGLVLLAGNPNWNEGIPQTGYHDGIAEYTLFNDPFMAVSWNGGVLVSDTENHVLRFIVDGMVETYAGNGESGYLDGNKEESLFYLPTGLAVDEFGNLYVADTGNGMIRKVTLEGEVSTYFSDLDAPTGLFWYDGGLYVTDIESNQIFYIKDGVSNWVAGQGIQVDGEWISGYTNGSVEEATFSLPQGIYVDEEGIYIGDVGNNAVRKIANGEVSTLYEEENLADPVAITKYQGVLYIGDPFMKNIYTFEEKEDGLEEENVQEELAEEIEETTVEELTEEVDSMNFFQKVKNSIDELFQWLKNL